MRSAENTEDATQNRELDRLIEEDEFINSIAEAKSASEMGTFDGLRFVKHSLSNLVLDGRSWLCLQPTCRSLRTSFPLFFSPARRGSALTKKMIICSHL